MKKKNVIVSWVLIAVMAVTSFAITGFAGADVSAASVNPIPKTLSVLYYPKDKDMNEHFIAWADEWTIKMSSVKSSKSKVAVLKKEKAENIAHYYIKIKKPGKTTITFKAKAKGSKKYVKKTIKVKAPNKYVRPVASLKIGKKNYASKFTKYDSFGSTKPLKGKVNIKAKKGWKVKSIRYWNSDTNKEKKIKNKSKVNIDNGFLVITFKKNGKKFYESLILDCTPLPGD